MCYSLKIFVGRLWHGHMMDRHFCNMELVLWVLIEANGPQKKMYTGIPHGILQQTFAEFWVSQHVARRLESYSREKNMGALDDDVHQDDVYWCSWQGFAPKCQQILIFFTKSDTQKYLIFIDHDCYFFD